MRTRLFVGKPDGKRPLGRRKYGWKDNIRMDLREIKWEAVDWMHPVQDRDQLRALVDMVMDLWDP
jgi:hypothetical protein